ncbi:hypothetical protein H7F51_17585 [Novosphingobium flavum]|uniref:DUF4158 domain-containing protein n=1 Tax=Novosphingobium flavum TaxID=1778672 RepID=A0A7X1KN54_9SPHN|nr:hypothetical protein [Novosphingobium flavum]MBC2667334.1 hypothetical protein [Novosphingobium flavum]
MPADFSHLSATTADMVVGYKVRYGQPTDEMLLEAAERIDPPLMSPELMELLRTELDPARQRRGRPRQGIRRAATLTDHLRELARTDIPPRFVELLIGRLTSGKGLREFTRALRAYRTISKLRRDNLIRGLYRIFYERLETATKGHIEHAPLGKVVIPAAANRSERALKMTAETMQRLMPPCPSEATIRNLVSGKIRRGFRESKRR